MLADLTIRVHRVGDAVVQIKGRPVDLAKRPQAEIQLSLVVEVVGDVRARAGDDVDQLAQKIEVLLAGAPIGKRRLGLAAQVIIGKGVSVVLGIYHRFNRATTAAIVDCHRGERIGGSGEPTHVVVGEVAPASEAITAAD